MRNPPLARGRADAALRSLHDTEDAILAMNTLLSVIGSCC